MENIIEVKNISYQYPSSTSKALDNLSFSVTKGEWVAIIGHNGSGKSTLAKLLNYLLVADAGEILIDGQLVNEANMWTVRNKVGMVFQNPENQFVGATVADDVAFGLENRGIERERMLALVPAALKEVQMDVFADREPTHLSGGQKQRVALAGIIAVAPKIIILDEATAMLDPKGRKEVIAAIRKLKDRLGKELTVISITHDIDEAADADRILVINDGQLVEEGTPATIFSSGQRLLALGLDVPYAEQLKLALKNLDVDVPEEYLDEERLVQWLWQLNLKM
ncbi:energy-coupling factor ABC transporter ATP-binding protein [Periweissella fabaria]|uniref:Energy-coupling factor transporter ATP-binding protein EcfA1 n=1 Tax=Periweissella fabaria TaxID=546157 RepID=A0ABM8Z5Q8_9LACO|nr:energy-coupling factor ABC transporter ATP-binding protein [Periweissella fabaria]MCM0596827.1 energy-coupling factor ABC transporter ATP-binding protein [Periweissella fabaria]CAH0416564.1 Energy-coupling factor transporter ATP-binding protein EcfA1 [Periweissella fabaria]